MKGKETLLEKVLTFSYENLNGFTEEELLDWGKDFTEEEKKWVRHHFITAQNGIKVTGSIFSLVRDSKPFKYTLSNESMFGYMDLQELKLARISSIQAKWLAFAAITVSVLVPFVIGFLITQTVRVDKKQVDELLRAL